MRYREFYLSGMLLVVLLQAGLIKCTGLVDQDFVSR